MMIKTLKKKKVLFPIIFFLEIFLIVQIANIFEIETANSLYGGIVMIIINCTVLIFVIKIIKDHKTYLSEVKMSVMGESLLLYCYVMCAVLALSVLIYSIYLVYKMV